MDNFNIQLEAAIKQYHNLQAAAQAATKIEERARADAQKARQVANKAYSALYRLFWEHVNSSK